MKSPPNIKKADYLLFKQLILILGVRCRREACWNLLTQFRVG
jgi:hypothetical protein